MSLTRRGFMQSSVAAIAATALPKGKADACIFLWLGGGAAQIDTFDPKERGDGKKKAGGYYDCWAIARRASLRELLINEGLAVHASLEIAPGHDLADYFGYPKRQFQRMRELEAFLRRAAHHDLDRSGLGLRLRFLSGGLAPASRLALGLDPLLLIEPLDPQHAHRVQAEDDDHRSRELPEQRLLSQDEVANRRGRRTERHEDERKPDDERER